MGSVEAWTSSGVALNSWGMEFSTYVFWLSIPWRNCSVWWLTGSQGDWVHHLWHYLLLSSPFESPCPISSLSSIVLLVITYVVFGGSVLAFWGTQARAMSTWLLSKWHYVIISSEQSPVSIGGIHNRNTAADGVVRKSRRVWNNPEWTNIVLVFPESLETLFICFDDHLPIWKKKCQTKTKQSQNPTRTPTKPQTSKKQQRNREIVPLEPTAIKHGASNAPAAWGDGSVLTLRSSPVGT